ncbi:UDP-N-acetylglucosamine 1-carboxyvinyltransferase [Listeria grandensis FSL F6-0971]|uniref:UDP-N-acetylglucosamine 1-carboxyvinyltransferase n=1 Tax=Listeria grandensis FSL F6-0971 TaxID=1265819 RepID=W7BH56_9LIST|nr:UDP-N-acetylglucosamine 1-carboxyvinyltransferase [Listeria grandensis FSL F6-0971]
MVEKLVIKGGNELSGTLRVDGAKNSAVALIPATILADSDVTIEGLPDISDVHTLYAILEELGGEIHAGPDAVTIDPSNLTDVPLPNGNVKKLRASYYLMGAMLGRFKKSCHRSSRWMLFGPTPD